MDGLAVTKGGVAEAPQQITPLRIPEGTNPTVFRSIVAAYTTAWRMKGSRPTADEVRALWPKVSVAGVSDILVTPEFREAMDGRGIDIGDTPGLSHQQHLVLMAISDPNDGRTLKQLLTAAGATTQQYANWQRSPIWQRAQHAMASRLWEDGVDDLRRTMLQQAQGGSFQHQQFVMETMGEGPKAREMQNARETIGQLVAAIQRATVGHPEIREAIMLEMQESRMAALALDQ